MVNTQQRQQSFKSIRDSLTKLTDRVVNVENDVIKNVGTGSKAVAGSIFDFLKPNIANASTGDEQSTIYHSVRVVAPDSKVSIEPDKVYFIQYKIPVSYLNMVGDNSEVFHKLELAEKYNPLPVIKGIERNWYVSDNRTKQDIGPLSQTPTPTGDPNWNVNLTFRGPSPYSSRLVVPLPIPDAMRDKANRVNFDGSLKYPDLHFAVKNADAGGNNAPVIERWYSNIQAPINGSVLGNREAKLSAIKNGTYEPPNYNSVSVPGVLNSSSIGIDYSLPENQPKPYKPYVGGMLSSSIFNA